ncbi:MAG: ASKHA domain-containing protein, partial [Oscillospiraceae bacterium]|nr:ASKHA domain-containing protein [Oscillospiraceae bacterium]
NMLSERHIINEKYRKERSAELAVACDITMNSIAVVYYDLALERRYARSVLFGVSVTPQLAAKELPRLIITSLREYSIKPSAVKLVGIAAPVHIESSAECEFTPSDLGFNKQCEVSFVPYISAGISGRFTASLLTLPTDRDWAAADLGKDFCIAHKTGGELHCAAFPLLGAFDGTALESGMPAENGAVDAVRRDNDKLVVYEVAGDCDSVGISPCGALMAAAEMQRSGILDSDGIMTDRDLFYIGEDLFVSQNDIRAIQADKARAAAAFELLPQTDAQMFFSGEPFSNAGGFRALLELGAIPERFKGASFCRNSTEQGIIMFLEDEEARERAFEFSRTANDFSRDNLLKFDKDYLNNLDF